MDAFVFVSALAHMFYTPYTKVEESFNLQAMHDILYWRQNFSQYDHHEFPGVVPRTFIGPLSISILSTPFIIFFEALSVNKFWAQYVVRMMLAAVVASAWTKLRDVIMKLFNIEVRIWYSMITLSQFHFIFYMSRPLPNIMALPIVLYALAYWLQGQMKPFIVCSGIAILIFRFELILFLAPLLVLDLLTRRISIDKFLRIALPAGIVIVASTVLIDSFFWKRLVWPEGEVLWYNTILNKSSQWGTSPFLWYFYSAIPRAMATSLFFVPVGFYLEKRIRAVVLAALIFVFAYSFLPHKELRFIIYIFPMLNLAAACACHRLWINSTKSWWQGLLATAAMTHLLLNLFVTIFLLMVSGTNYPGGEALTRLHHLEKQTPFVSVHIDNLAAQSGVSRFLQIHDHWNYCKNESITYAPHELQLYTHLLVEAKNRNNADIWSTLSQHYEAMDYVDCFNSIGIQYNSLLPVRIKTKPCIVILKRNNLLTVPITVESKTAEMLEEEQETIVSLVEEIDDINILEAVPDIVHTSSTQEKVLQNETEEEIEAAEASVKEINFQELHNLALGKASLKKSKATKLKLRQVIEQHLRDKGRHIENDTLLQSRPQTNMRQSVKAIIKQERIKEMIEQIASMDLTRVCNLDKMSTKDCLKQVIDTMDVDYK